MDADEEASEGWDAEDDVKGGRVDPRSVKTAHEKETKYLWDMELYPALLNCLGLTDGTDDVGGPNGSSSLWKMRCHCEKWLHHVHNTSLPSRELHDT